MPYFYFYLIRGNPKIRHLSFVYIEVLQFKLKFRKHLVCHLVLSTDDGNDTSINVILSSMSICDIKRFFFTSISSVQTMGTFVIDFFKQMVIEIVL